MAVLPDATGDDRVAGHPARRDRRRLAVEALAGLLRLPNLGLRALARGVLVGGREVRLARAASAAAARAARRRGPAGHLGGARRLARGGLRGRRDRARLRRRELV